MTTRTRQLEHKVGHRTKGEITRAAKAELKKGYSPKTAAGEFVHEGIEHVKEGQHGAKNPKQAIAIGLSKARRAGIPVPPPKRKKSGSKIRH